MPSCSVIFDLDGTLVDTKDLAIAATSVALEQNGFSDIVVDEESYNFGSRYVTPKRLAWHATGQADNACGPLMAATFEKYVSELVTTENTPLFSGITELLQYLKIKDRIHLSILSNASGSYVQNVLRHHQLSDTFKIAYGADEVSGAKPLPDGLIAIQQKVNVDPANCVYIGDSPTDGTAASNANMYSIGVTWGNNSAQDLEAHFNRVVSTPNELRAAIDAFLDNRAGPSSCSSENTEPKRRVSWQNDVIDNEHMNKFRTDDEYWDGR